MKISPARRLARLRRRILAAIPGMPGKIIRGEKDPAAKATTAREFGDLSESHRLRGDPDLAKSVLQDGLALHPDDHSLQIKFAAILTEVGRPSEAIESWNSIIARHREKDLAPAYLGLGRAFREEGLLERAARTLRDGIGKFPDHAGLRDALADLSLSLVQQAHSSRTSPPASPSTAHLFTDRFEPHGKGRVAIDSGGGVLKKHVPMMLDFAEKVPVSAEPDDLKRIDAFAIWGVPTERHSTVRNLATLAGKPMLCIDSGFLGFSGMESKQAPAHSIIVSPEHAYCDATRPSPLTDSLNSDDYTLTPDQRLRVENCITSIVSNRVSKSNHAPRIDLRQQFPADGTRRLLLVDQRKGGSIHWSLGGPATFKRMWEAALSTPDRQILVKLHPEVIAGRARSMLAEVMPGRLPGNVTLIDFDVNPFDLFDVVDEVFVGTSQLGFEAVMAGKEVHCFAAPFYAGWGFTRDRLAIPARRKGRTAADVFHLYYIVHSRYFVPGRRRAEIEDVIEYLSIARKSPPSGPGRNKADTGGPLKILMVIPSSRYGATGRYLQNLSISLVRLGCEVMILAKGPCKSLETGVRWRTLEFAGTRLTEALRREIVEFSPHFIYENGVRARSQRAALEAMFLTNARFVMQSMDDDVQIQRERQGGKAAESLVALDRPELTTAEIASFLGTHDWNQSLRVFLDPESNCWIEPLLRIFCYRVASFHTAIWHPYAERLSREYGVPVLVVPPVASAADFTRIPMTAEERADALQRYGIDPACTLIFIGGAIYGYSGEFAVFLKALDLAANKSGGKFALVLSSVRSPLPLGRMAAETLNASISFTDIGMATDERYMEMLKACDIVCSPGLPDDFTRYRLPSRLVKAMAMAKPVLTCSHGFGESLEHGKNAFLMDGEDPLMWADTIALCLDVTDRARIGLRGKDFAREHFDSDRVAGSLKKEFENHLFEPRHNLSSGIVSSPDQNSPQLLRSIKDDNSALQFAIRALAELTHQIDTVIHVEAGCCRVLEDYCRLGARLIILLESCPEFAAKLRKQGNPEHETIVIHSCAGNEPAFAEICENLDLTGQHNLLVLEMDDTSVKFGDFLLPEFVWKFRWVICNIDQLDRKRGGAEGQNLDRFFGALGFQRIPLNVDHVRSNQLFFYELDANPQHSTRSGFFVPAGSRSAIDLNKTNP